MFLDIGIGIIAVIFAAELYNVPITISLLIFSVFFSLVPDIDFLIFYPKRKDTKYDYKHRNYVHYPLVYLPLGYLIIFLILGKVYALVFLLSSLLHFVHDSIGVGWGVKWLYPFSKKNYAFIYLYSRKEKKGLRKLLFSFDQKNLAKYVRIHGDANWVENIYFKWHPIAIVEFLFFIFSMVTLIIYVN